MNKNKIEIKKQILDKFPIEQITNFDEYVKSNRYIGIDFIKRDYNTLRVIAKISFYFLPIVLSIYFSWLMLYEDSFQKDLSIVEKIPAYLSSYTICLMLTFLIATPISFFIRKFFEMFLKKCPKCQSLNMYHKSIKIVKTTTGDVATTINTIVTSTITSITTTTSNNKTNMTSKTNTTTTTNNQYPALTIYWVGHAYICRKKDCDCKNFDIEKKFF